MGARFRKFENLPAGKGVRIYDEGLDGSRWREDVSEGVRRLEILKFLDTMSPADVYAITEASLMNNRTFTIVYYKEK